MNQSLPLFFDIRVSRRISRSRKSRTRRTTLWLILLAATQVTGCYSSWDIQPNGLQTLNGFRSGQTVDLRATNGEHIPFTSDSYLDVVGIDEASTMSFRASQIDIYGKSLQAIDRDDRSPIHIDLTRVESVEVDIFSAGKTAGFVVGVAVVPSLALLTAATLLSGLAH